MKKNLLYALTAAAMLTGCARNDVVDSEINKDGNQIGFSTYKNISRGNPINDNAEFLARGEFGVTAFISSSTSPYMGTATQGIQIIPMGDTWTYAKKSDQAYWPAKALDFYAYAPFDNAAITGTAFDKTTGLTLDYVVPNDEAGQVDLMYAVAKNQMKPESSNSVTLPFKHALAQVHFRIGTSATNLYVDVAQNGIQIHNLKNKGSFSSSTEEWTLEAAIADYTVTSEAVSEAGYELDADKKQVFTPIGSPDHALILLPQSFSATGENGAYLTISCSIYQKLEDGTKVYLHGEEGVPEAVTVKISGEWLKNQKITYNLLIGAGAGVLDPIEFVTDVERWDDVEGGVIEAK